MKDREVDVAAVASTEDGETVSGEGRTVLQVECGLNKAVLHLERLCQGSKGACILFEKTWMTPNEFQAASGRETAKDWKRSIKHHDKSLKLLINKGFLFVDPAVCKCEHCVPSSSSESPPSPTKTTSSSESPKETQKKPSKKVLAKLAKKQKLNNVIAKKSAKVSKPKHGGKRPTSPVRQLRKRKLPVGRREKRLSARKNVKKATTTAKPKRGARLRGAKKGAKRKTPAASETANADQDENGDDNTDVSQDEPEDVASETEANTSSPKQNGASGDETDSDANSSIKSDSATSGKLSHKKDASSNSDTDMQDDEESAATHAVKHKDEGPDELNGETEENKDSVNKNGAENEGSSTQQSLEKASKKRRKVCRQKMSNGKTVDDDTVSCKQKHAVEDCNKAKPGKCDTSASTAVTDTSNEPDCKPDSATVDDDVVSDSKSAGPADDDVVSDCTTDGPAVEDVVSECKNDGSTDTDGVVSDSKKDGLMDTNFGTDYKTEGHTNNDDAVSDSKTDGTPNTDVVLDCKAERYTVDSVVTYSKTSGPMDTDVVTDFKVGGPIDNKVATDSKTECSAVDEVVSDCETIGSGELIIAEPKHDEEHEPTDDAATIDKADICANSVSADDGTSQKAINTVVPTPTVGNHSNGSSSDALSGAENDQFATPKSENPEINTEKNSSAENVGPADDVTKEHIDNLTSPAARGEVISPKREARLLNIIQELKTYKKQLSAKIDEKKRHADHILSPPDKISRLLHPGGLNPERLSPSARDTNSEPPSSGLQQASSVLHPALVSSAGDLMNAAPRRQKSRRKESAIIRQLTGPTVGQARTQAWVNENGATVYYTAQPNGVGSLPFSTYRPEPRVDATNQIVHSDNRRFTNNNVDNSDKCLLKIPKRYSANASFPVQNGRAAPAIPEMSARKRKMATPRTNSAAKRQRCSWPMNKPDSAACLLDLTKCITGDAAAKSVTCGVSYGGAHPQSGAHQTEKTLSEVQAAAMTRPVRRSHISSWTADDVYSFVLSSPHAAIYAKEFLELRITGRVLQNLTAIQMMRILRIGEHAARAVRTAVEKILMTSPATNHGARR